MAIFNKKLCEGLFFIVNNPLLFLTDKNDKDFIKIAAIITQFYVDFYLKKFYVKISFLGRTYSIFHLNEIYKGGQGISQDLMCLLCILLACKLLSAQYGLGKGERGKGKGKREKGKREKGKGERGKVSNTFFTLYPLTFSKTTREVHTAYPNRIGCKLSRISVDCEPSTITGSRELW